MMAGNDLHERTRDPERGRLLVGHCDDASIVVGLVGDARTLIRLDLDEATRFAHDLGKLIRSLKRSQHRKMQGGER